MSRAEMNEAEVVSDQRFADVGPGRWWFVHHPDGFLIEIGADQALAELVAREITAGRSYLSSLKDSTDGR